jgi:hypothetical protein
MPATSPPTPHPHRLLVPSHPCICARARRTGQELAQGGKATNAPESPALSTAAPRGDGSPTGKLGTRGSPSCNRNLQTTLRIAARWPPLPASEASGCALLVTAHPDRSKAVSLTRPQFQLPTGGRDTGARWSVGSAAVAFALFALVLPSSLARFSGSWFPERWRIVGVHVQQDWSSADATAAKARTSNHRRPRLAFWHA